MYDIWLKTNEDRRVYKKNDNYAKYYAITTKISVHLYIITLIKKIIS